MGISFGHIIVVVLLVLVLFGKGRISAVMEDLGKGIKNFKKGLAEDDTHPTPPALEKKARESEIEAAADACSSSSSSEKNDLPKN